MNLADAPITTNINLATLILAKPSSCRNVCHISSLSTNCAKPKYVRFSPQLSSHDAPLRSTVPTSAVKYGYYSTQSGSGCRAPPAGANDRCTFPVKVGACPPKGFRMGSRTSSRSVALDDQAIRYNSGRVLPLIASSPTLLKTG